MKKKTLETLLQAVRIYSDDIGIEFGIEKYAMLIMRSIKRQKIEGMELPNQEKIRTLGEKETYQIFGNIGSGTIKQAEMKERIKKEYLRRTRKLIKT